MTWETENRFASNLLGDGAERLLSAQLWLSKQTNDWLCQRSVRRDLTGGCSPRELPLMNL